MNAKKFAAMMPNDTDRFLLAIQEQFGKTMEEAKHILALFKREKIVKFDRTAGGLTLSWGGFWEADVMDNALKMEL